MRMDSALALLATVAGVAYAAGCAAWVVGRDRGDDGLQAPYGAIFRAAHAFFRTQYGIILVVGIVLTVLLWLVPAFGPLTAAGFALGGLCSAAAGRIGMAVAVRANVRTAAAAAKGLAPALRVSVRAGSVTGFLVGALALGCVTGFYLLLAGLGVSGTRGLDPLLGLGFGASLISIFGRLGGGIFTKAADVGADLVGKMEQRIPEDDARNPAVIADNVGDNVGDCAGMAADLFESYVVTLVSAMLLAAWALPGARGAMEYPLALGAAGMAASLVGIQAARLPRGGRVLGAFTRCAFATSLAAVAAFYGVTVISGTHVPPHGGPALFGAAVTGLGVAFVLAAVTVYYTGDRYSPVRRIASASEYGHATNVITGLAVSMRAVAWPTLAVAAGVIVSHALAGLYGIAVASCAMLSLTPVVVSVDAYGPVTDNAGGIAEMARQAGSVREITDALDAAGNTTKAVTKAFAIASAGLAALVLFSAFRSRLAAFDLSARFDIADPYVLGGLLAGALLPFLFSSYALDAVGRAAGCVVAEVRAQFEREPGILAGTASPDYGRTVEILTKISLKSMILPALIPVMAPLIVGLVWYLAGSAGNGLRVVGGMLLGSIASGFLLAVSMCTGGAAWDNAKKYIEMGHEGGKGSIADQAAITGDTVGDPYKDTAGPAINPMIKILNVVALLMVSFMH